MHMNNDVTGVAALTICESLLLSLGDRKILPEKEIIGILEDAIGAHLNAAPHDGMAKVHEEAAALIRSIIDSGNLFATVVQGGKFMNEVRAAQYRRAAEQCLEQAELAPNESMKFRMRALADQWLLLTASVSVMNDLN